jgi:cytochrome c5
MKNGLCRNKRSSPEHADERLAAAVILVLAALVTPHPAHAQGGDRSGREVVDSVCSSCHGTGVKGAPRIGDKQAWNKRASQGLTSLTQHALQGIRQMPAHGGNPELTDLEIGRAITDMVNRSGGHWVEPVSATAMAAERSGEQVVKAQCVKCHQAGLNGAPKIGDRDAWIPRLKLGIDNLVRSAIRGHGGMPPRGGQANLTDGELRNAIIYMFNPGAASASQPRDTVASSGAKSSARTDAAHKTVGGMDIYLGFIPAEALLAYPKDSPERTMHGGVPKGSGYYHVNVSLLESSGNAPINGAQVEVLLEEPGMARESRTLEAMGIGAASYGNYLKVRTNAPYIVTVRVRKPGSSRIEEARFERRFE